MRHAAALPSIPLLAGCACGLLLDHPPLALTTIALAAAMAVSAWAAATRRPHVIAMAVVIGSFAGGARLGSVAWQQAWRTPLRADFARLAAVTRADAAREGRRLPIDDEVSATVAGVLETDAMPGPTGVSLLLRVDTVEGQGRSAAGEGQATGERKRTHGSVQLTVVGSLAADRFDDWRAGRRVRLPVQLRRPARYLDPGVPDGEKALARRGVTLVGTVKSGALVEVQAPASMFDEALSAARASSRRAIHRAVGRWNPQSGAIVAAIVVGDRSTLDDEVQTRLQEAGTYHVIAISGGNIAILAGLLVGAFKIAGWLGRGAMASAIGVLLAYDAFVGGGASVNRATLMAVLYFGARLFDQRTPPLNALAAAAALLTIADPLAVVDPAFLLTYGATLAILVIVPAIDLSRVPRPLAGMAAVANASVAAELVLFPIGALFFARVTLAGLALNFLAIPLMSIAQIAGMAVLPLDVINPHAAMAAGWLAHLGAAVLIESAALIRFVPAIAWRVAVPSAAALAIYYLALAVAWAAGFRGRSGRAVHGPRAAARTIGAAARTAAGRGLRRLRRGAALATAAAGLWIALDPRTFLVRGDGRLHATFIDVGQGDAALIVFPNGGTLLVDAGGLGFSSSFDIGDRVVAPVVRSLGFRRLDRLALTHGDPDHIGGAPAIVREFRPAEVWEGIPVPRSDPLTALRRQAQQQGARWSNVHDGDRVIVDGVEVVARHPQPEDWERQKVRNDDSLVLELRWREVSIVLTGDIGRVPEQRIAEAFAPARLRVVKVPHHGSLTSSSAGFVHALRPTVAVVSAGRSNHFGHPAPEVLARYEAAGAAVYRTDRDGAISIATDGHSLTVATFGGEGRVFPELHAAKARRGTKKPRRLVDTKFGRKDATKARRHEEMGKQDATEGELQPVHHAQLLGYLRASRLRAGLLANFNVPVLRDGIKRIVP